MPRDKWILPANNNNIERHKKYIEFVIDFFNRENRYPTVFEYKENIISFLIREGTIQGDSKTDKGHQLKQPIFYNMLEIVDEKVIPTFNGKKFLYAETKEEKQKAFLSLMIGSGFHPGSSSVNERFKKIHPIRELLNNLVSRDSLSFEELNGKFHYENPGEDIDSLELIMEKKPTWRYILSMLREMEFIDVAEANISSINTGESYDPNGRIIPTKRLLEMYNVNDVNFINNIIMPIIELNKKYVIKMSFDGPRVLTGWAEESKKGDKRAEKNILDSWKSISKENLPTINSDMKKNPFNHVIEMSDEIIEYWMKHENQLAYTGIAFWLLSNDLIHFTNIDYTPIISSSGEIKNNIETKYREFIPFIDHLRELFNEGHNISFNDEDKETDSPTKKYVPKLRDTSNFKDKEILKAKQLFVIEQYREDFRKNLDEQYETNNSIEGSNYKLTDRAHIHEVRDIKKLPEKEWIQISDPNNGLYLEPNVHREWDNGHLILTEAFEFIDAKTGITKYTLKKEYQNSGVKSYIKKRNKSTK